MADPKKILIVDDEPDMVEWLEAFFKDNGYETLNAYDGFEGFEKTKAERPDLITLDITMDKESGVKMYKKLKESDETKAIPVIIVTGVTPEFRRFISTRRKVDPPEGYFEKPVDKDALLKKVQELLS